MRSFANTCPSQSSAVCVVTHLSGILETASEGSRKVAACQEPVLRVVCCGVWCGQDARWLSLVVAHPFPAGLVHAAP